MKRWYGWLILLLLLTVLWIVPPVRAQAPTGAGPNDALRALDTPQTLAVNKQVWYYFDYSGFKSRIQIFLDDGGAPDVVMSIYTSDLAQQWVTDRTVAPVGRGTKSASGAAATYDLVWQGAFQIRGRYFVTVGNNGSTPIRYRLMILGADVALGPTPTPTPGVTLANPYAPSVPQGSVTGRVLFQDASGGNIYLVNGDGTNLRRIESGLDPAMSPDGKKIAFARWSAPIGLYVADADGTNEKLVFGANKVLSPQWSPDGTRIAFTRLDGGSMEDKVVCLYADLCYTFVADPHFKIGVLDAASYALTEPKCSKHCFAPTWSADNHTLAYADANFGLLVTDATPNGSAESNLYTQNPNVQAPRYNPDGSRIIFQARGSDHWNINVIGTNGGGAMPVTWDDPLGFTRFNSVAPAWSPDGKQILYLADRNGKWEFYAANVDGSNVRQVLKNVTDSITIAYNFSNERVADWIP